MGLFYLRLDQRTTVSAMDGQTIRWLVWEGASRCPVSVAF